MIFEYRYIVAVMNDGRMNHGDTYASDTNDGDTNHGGQPSWTALTAAAARAAHLIVDGSPVIFADTLAPALLGGSAEELIGYHRLHGTHPVLAGARTQVTCRGRYAEDALARAVGRGLAQYVILGAGADTFAYRSDLAGGVRVFEVDHPATQRWKRRALAAANIQKPANLTFVPADLTTDSLADCLGRAGCDLSVPVLVGWLGVTMYLTREAIGTTLAVIGGFARGSELIADYMLPADMRDEEGDMFATLVGRSSAERGEPWLSSFAPEEMTDLARGHGFATVLNVRQRDAIPAALWDRADSLRPTDLAVLLHGTI
jgi:methyltransferase (TIGR00027 family)